MKKLIKEICKREGKKSQVAIGNVREIVKVLATILVEDCFKETQVFQKEWDDYSDKIYNKLEKKQEKEVKKEAKKLLSKLK